jgi:hypothetical protein
MFKSLFAKNKIKINKVNHGSHGDHWGAFFGFENLIKDQDILLGRINQLMESKKAEKVDKQYSVIKENLGNIDMKVIVDSQVMVSCFPSLESNNKIPFENKIVNEWNHVDGIEAQIGGSGRKTFGLIFFATDYLENKKIYQQNQELEINLSGFAYVIQESTKLPDNFSEDFVSCMPNKQINDSSVYDFVGKIIDFKEYSFEDIDGFIITTKLINHEEMEDFFVLDIFVNKQNLKIEKPKKGMRISGCFWLQGNIAKD